MLKKLYLVAYNVASALVWGHVLVQGAVLLAKDAGTNPAKHVGEFSRLVADELWLVQHAALLEILHSATGMVPSPLVTTTVQVLSRVVILDVFTFPGKKYTFQDASFYLMVMSWSLVEVVRYTFYAVQLLAGKVPEVLFFLRYSLFFVLYPTGISGEILQQVASYPHWRVTPGFGYVERLSHVFLLFCYVPLGPYMISSMYQNRKSQYAKRRAPKPAEPEGLVWPVTNPKTGDRSSTEVTKKIWAAAARGFSDPDRANKEYARIIKERDWRWGYMGAVIRNVSLSCESPRDALAIAKAGLSEARGLFVFSRGGKLYSLENAMSKDGPRGSTFFTGVIRGYLALNPRNLGVPYFGRKLEGAALKAQLEQLASVGTIEPSAAKAISLVVDNADSWLDLSNEHVCMLGASSAMGPFADLIDHGAVVVAVDLPRPKIWEGLIARVRASGATLVFPMSKPQSECKSDQELFAAAGCDMLRSTPELGDWLCSLDTKGRPLTVGNYTYLDGALHVQLAMAGEMLMDRLCKERPDTRLAFLCTPTDVHVIPKAAREHAQQRIKNAPWWQRAYHALGVLKRNDLVKPVNELCVVDGIVSRQGPNYILAKRLQHWRAIIARDLGHTVCSNVAPSTFTLSVVSNPLFKLGYKGWVYFPPLEVAAADLSNTVMFALLVHDLRNPSSKSHPGYKLGNPLELFSWGSFHGGIWRAGWTVDSIGAPAFLFGAAHEYANLALLAIALVAMAAWYIVLSPSVLGAGKS